MEEQPKEQESKIPSFLQNRIDNKADTIWAFNSLCRAISSGKFSEISGNIQVSLLTPLGIVTGNIEDIYMSDEDKPTDNVTILSELGFTFRNTSLTEFEESKDNLTVINNTSTITVRNATVTSWSTNKSFSFEVLYLFASDITGFSLGSNPTNS